MHFINLYLLSLTKRKFFIKTGCLLIFFLGMYLPDLAANSDIPPSPSQANLQLRFVQEWLYNYYEEPDRLAIKITTTQLSLMINKFRRRKDQYRTEEEWLKDIFYQVHGKLLKRYKNFSAVPDLIKQGNYDCVSGTALYALICELLYIPYSIRETEYHVYLLALVDGKKVLIESTDPVYGFVSEPYTVQSLIKAYQEDNSSKYKMLSPMNNRVNWAQLAGLQYFNKAVKFYNNTNYQEALSYLDKAMQYYRSSRIVSFKEHILQLRTSRGC